jgi:hypothetical protein
MSECVWGIGGMILTGDRLSTGKELYTAVVGDDKISVVHGWNDTDRGQLKYWERYIIQRWW